MRYILKDKIPVPEVEDIHKEFCDRVKEFKLNRVKRKKIKLQIRGTWREK